MHPTLFYIPRQIGSVPLVGFGLLLAIWIVLGAAVFVWIVRRQGFTADTWGYVPILLLIAAGIAFVLPAMADERGIPVRGYGAMLVLAVSSACWVASRRAGRMGLDPELLFSLGFWVFLAGLVGARLFYVVQKWDEFHQATTPLGTLIEIVNVAQGGLVIYGGLFGGTLAVLVFLWLYRLPILAVGDLVSAPVALGLALGRIGCFLTGCCFGGTTELPWAVQFPEGSPPFIAQVERGQLDWHGMQLPGTASDPPRIAGVAAGSTAEQAGLVAPAEIREINGHPIRSLGSVYAALLATPPGGELVIRTLDQGAPVRFRTSDTPPVSLPVHPAQLYSVINALVLFAFLSAWYPLRRRDGEVAALLITIYPLTRFLLEAVRSDEPAAWGTGLSISQNVSLLVLAGAPLFWWMVLRRPTGSVLPAGRSSATAGGAAGAGHAAGA